MLFGSLVELHALLHSYVYFSLLEKLFLSNLDTSSTPSRHLVICRAPKLFFIAILTHSRQLVDRSRKFLDPRQLLDSWWIDRDSLIMSDEFFLDISRQLHLSTFCFLDTWLDTYLDTSICQDLLNLYIQVLCNPAFISLDLSLDSFVSSPP